MRITSRLSTLATAAAVLGLAACADTTGTRASLYDEPTVTRDLAASAGDAIASAVSAMAANEAAASLGGAGLASMSGDPMISFTRTRTCYDADGAVVPGCIPISAVRTIVTHASIDGSRSGTHTTEGGRTVTWTGAVHRISDDTLKRNFNEAEPPVEVSRTHSGLTVGHDTTTFTDGEFSRWFSEASLDSVKAVTWNLPRSSNPFPVSGSIVRVDSVKVVLTKGTRTETKELVRTISVTFPADAQGNVVLQINDKTCNLNLVTRVVSNCQ